MTTTPARGPPKKAKVLARDDKLKAGGSVKNVEPVLNRVAKLE